MFLHVLPRTHLDTCGREVAGFLAVKLGASLLLALNRWIVWRV